MNARRSALAAAILAASEYCEGCGHRQMYHDGGQGSCRYDECHCVGFYNTSATAEQATAQGSVTGACGTSSVGKPSGAANNGSAVTAHSAGAVATPSNSSCAPMPHGFLCKTASYAIDVTRLPVPAQQEASTL